MKLSKERLLVTADELALMLGVSARTVWRLNSTAMLPRPLKLNRSVRWKHADITDWIAQDCPSRATFESS